MSKIIRPAEDRPPQRIDYEEHKRLDAFSGQTRQTKTALMLIAPSLLAYATIGQPLAKEVAGRVQILPWPYTVPTDALFLFLFVGTSYFLISFLISATYELNRYAYVARLTDAIGFLFRNRDEVQKLEQDAQTFLSGRVAEFSRVRELTKAIGLEKVASVAADSSNHDVKVEMENVRRLVQEMHSMFFPDPPREGEALPAYFIHHQVQIQQIANSYKAESDKWLARLYKEEARLQGLSTTKHRFWEYRVPIIVSAACLVISLLVEIERRGWPNPF